MLTSPLEVMLDVTEHEVSRINNDNFSSTYLKKWALNELRLTIRHSYEGKAGISQIERHNVDIVHTIWDAEGNSKSYQSYLVVRCPRGTDGVDARNVATAVGKVFADNKAAIMAWES